MLKPTDRFSFLHQTLMWSAREDVLYFDQELNFFSGDRCVLQACTDSKTGKPHFPLRSFFLRVVEHLEQIVPGNDKWSEGLREWTGRLPAGTDDGQSVEERCREFKAMAEVAGIRLALERRDHNDFDDE